MSLLLKKNKKYSWKFNKSLFFLFYFIKSYYNFFTYFKKTIFFLYNYYEITKFKKGKFWRKREKAWACFTVNSDKSFPTFFFNKLRNLNINKNELVIKKKKYEFRAKKIKVLNMVCKNVQLLVKKIRKIKKQREIFKKNKNFVKYLRIKWGGRWYKKPIKGHSSFFNWPQKFWKQRCRWLYLEGRRVGVLATAFKNKRRKSLFGGVLGWDFSSPRNKFKFIENIVLFKKKGLSVFKTATLRKEVFTRVTPNSFIYFFNTLFFYPHNFQKCNFFFKRGKKERLPDVVIADEKDMLISSLIIKFLENKTGKSVYLNIWKNKLSLISFEIMSLLRIWSFRLLRYSRKFEQKIDIFEFLKFTQFSLLTRDVNLLFNLINKNLEKIKFWHHRIFFSFVYYILKHYFVDIYERLGIKGVQLELKGKVGLMGKARKRKQILKVSNTSKSNYRLKVKYLFKPMKTVSGALGLKIWFYHI